MDFRKATDVLFKAVSHADLAKELGDKSVPSIRQARLDPSAQAYRSPPPDWERAVAKLARERGKALLRLAEQLEGRR